MVHKRFAYVVLASIISSRIIAAPVAQASEPPSMCSDRTIPWEEKIDICDICDDIPNLPRKIWNRYCGVDGPETHSKAQGINRRDAAGSMLYKGGEEDVEFHTSHPTGDAVTADETKVTNLEDSRDEAANGIVEKPEHQGRLNGDIINHKPASGVWRRQRTHGEMPCPEAHERAKSVGFKPPTQGKKREADHVPALNGQFETKLLNDVIVHEGASGVWRRQQHHGDIPWPKAHEQAKDIGSPDPPTQWKKRAANPVPALEGQSEAKPPNDIIVHEGASGVWRRQQQGNHNPTWPKAHQQSNGIGSPYPVEWKKREADSVPAVQGQSEAKFLDSVVIHKPVPEVWRRRANVTLPSAPIVHPQAADISNDDGEVPASSKKRETDPVSPPELFEDGALIEDPAPQTTPQTQDSTEQPAPDSIQATAQKITGHYDYKTPPHFTPAIVHAAANDIHRREERVQACEWVG